MACNSRAALYIRVSTEEQAAEGQSIDAQVETLRQYCTLYGIEIYRIYKDLGISGKSIKNRPGIKSMLADAKDSKFDILLVWKISRLSRSLKDLLFILEQLDDCNITFHSYSEKFDTSTPVGKMTLQLLGSIAEFERNTIIDNVKLGLREYARKGGKTGTVFGYDNKHKQLVINPDEADAVRLIYRLYCCEGYSMTEIAHSLNAAGFRTKRGNMFSKDSISVILGNPVYIGVNRHHTKKETTYEIAGTHEPIVDKTIWNKAQQLRDTNKNQRSKSGSYSFLLTGKLVCPRCSSRMYGFTSSSGSKKYKYYRCKECSLTCRADKAEEDTINKLKALLNDNHIYNAILYHFGHANIGDDKEVRLELLEKETKHIARLMEKYLLLLEQKDFKDSKLFAAKLLELENRSKLLSDEKSAVLREMNTTGLLQPEVRTSDKIEHILKDSNLLWKLVREMVQSIMLTQDKRIGDIYFTAHPSCEI